SSPMTQSHRPARLATRAASFRYGGRHHSGIPGAIIPLYPGDFVGIRTGRGSLLRLSQVGVLPGQINAVFFTHMHSDHTEGFPEIAQLC
ncbi:MAG: MBL fold metallo-hydrolase, partial [Alphaproteobacteria bacterium]|nr:MBL fold metallo-hydrolase [Alphaproteobacteria bacterium]